MADATTREHPHIIFKNHAKKLPHINAFSIRIVNDWNKLPSYIVQVKSINSFKNKLDKYCREEMYATPYWSQYCQANALVNTKKQDILDTGTTYKYSPTIRFKVTNYKNSVNNINWNTKCFCAE